jgi:predicted O-methyltransferase YrrM
MDNIIFCRVPITPDGSAALDFETTKSIVDQIRNTLGNGYTVIAAPLELTKVNGDFNFIQIDAKQYNYNELVEIIEKATMYDDLCD